MELLHQPGEIIAERYRIIDTLGQGGSGITYLAEDLQNSQKVALKALSLHRMSDWKTIELFEREARVLAQLNHPAIPRYLEYFHVDTPSDRCFYIAQEVAEGKSLATLVQDGWRSSEKEVRNIATQILEILIYLHSLTPPVIHRDIKPQNIIRKSDGQVFIVDFGAVQDTYHSTFMRGSTVVGTFGYMAPEQFRGQAVPTTDLYSLGATLLFLLTHRSPADLPTDGLRIAFRSRVQISEEFADWLEKMLEPDVEDRFTSAKEALEVLRGKKTISGKARSVRSGKAIVKIGVATIASFIVLGFITNIVLDLLGFGLLHLEVSTPGGFEDTEFNIFPTRNSPNMNTFRILVWTGSNVNAKAYKGNTPLHLVATMHSCIGECYDNEWDSKEMAELLISRGADVNAKNNEGQTPLHLPIAELSVAELLIARGADVNAKDNQGRTPLHLAVAKHQEGYLKPKNDFISLLLTKGADVNARDNQGHTVLYYAVASKYLYAVELLKNHGGILH